MERDMASLYVVELSAEVSVIACRLLTRHKLRASDAVHLASALLVTRKAEGDCQFVGFDANLDTAAEREGLRVLGPSGRNAGLW